MISVQFGVLGIGDFHRVVSDVHRRLSDFIHAVVVHRRDEAIREWRNRIREDPYDCIFIGGFVLIWFLPLFFCSCKPHLTPSGSGVLADPARIDEEFRKAWASLFLSLWAKGYQP